MKIWPLCALTLFAATLAPAITNAQAPSGVARVDSDTYFDTENASWGYHNHQTNFTEQLGEPAAAWPEIENDSSDHAGLLGKTYVRGAYLYNGMDDNSAIIVDSALDGWDVELNAPIPWVSSDTIGTDFFAKYEYRSFSGINRSPVIPFDRKAEFMVLGARIFAFPNSRIRPYVSLAAGFTQITTEASGFPTEEEDDDGLVTNLGIEADLASNASIRADFDIDRNQIDDSTFEGTIVLWLGENVFFRGGGVIPLTDGFDPGVTIGGGVAFR
ncbi:MAG: hypothetical protein ACI8P0_003199 [Planctomycetaceae bacterium]|jgi:hypothetical protein